MKHLIASACSAVILAASIGSAVAAPLSQYAGTVLAVSSEYGSSRWNAGQVLGTPNTPFYGDHATAWAPRNQNGTLEFISVSFGTAVYATGATIRETSGNGFVYQIDAIDTFGNFHKVWSGVDTSPAYVAYDFAVAWDITSFQVAGLKVYVNTDHSSTWEEIDSILLSGDTELPPPAPVPEPASVALMGLGLGLAGLVRRRRKA
jgi:hypothetical protein